MSNGTPPPPPGAPAAKKGLSTWAWVAIGCGGLIVVCLVAFLALGAFVFQKGKEAVQEATGAESWEEMVEDLQDNPAKVAAEMVVRMNPDLDLVASDDEAGTMTIRDRRTGEEATLNFEDLAEGRFSMTTSEGEYSLDASAAAEGGGVTMTGPDGEARFGAGADQGKIPDWVPSYPGATDSESTYWSETATGASGAVTSKTSDDAQTVMDRLEKELEAGGFEITNKSMNTTPGGALGALGGSSNGRTLNVLVVEQSGETQVTINYNHNKQ